MYRTGVYGVSRLERIRCKETTKRDQSQQFQKQQKHPPYIDILYKEMDEKYYFIERRKKRLRIPRGFLINEA